VLDLVAQVTAAEVARYAAVPTIELKLRLTEKTGARVHAAVLRSQIMIEPQRRRYSLDEEERLVDLFGEPARWGESLRPFLWTQIAATTGSFSAATDISLPVVCTYDLEVASSRYLHGIGEGPIPLLILFSGTIFRTEGSHFMVEPIAWSFEARYLLPAEIWRDVMDLYFPDSGWLRLSRTTLDALAKFKAERALLSWEEAIQALLGSTGHPPGEIVYPQSNHAGSCSPLEGIAASQMSDYIGRRP